LTALWTKTSGPGIVTFANATAATTTASFTVDDTYVLQLMVNDSHLATSDEVTITVHPAPPGLPAGGGGGLLIAANGTLTIAKDQLFADGGAVNVFARHSTTGRAMAVSVSNRSTRQRRRSSTRRRRRCGS
jgi:hypothetical protein